MAPLEVGCRGAFLSTFVISGIVPLRESNGSSSKRCTFVVAVVVVVVCFCCLLLVVVAVILCENDTVHSG